MEVRNLLSNEKLKIVCKWKKSEKYLPELIFYCNFTNFTHCRYRHLRIRCRDLPATKFPGPSPACSIDK